MKQSILVCPPVGNMALRIPSEGAFARNVKSYCIVLSEMQLAICNYRLAFGIT